MNRINWIQLRADFKKIPYLIIGLFLLSLGITLLRLSGNGLDAWGVFHEGLSSTIGLPFGVISILVGFAILIISLPFKIIPGIGTLMNIILVGPMIDGLFATFNHLNLNNYVLLILGFLILNFGRAMYISSNMGAGPRDALYVGITRIFKVKVTYTKPIIELSITIVGFLLGGTIGVGLLILTIFSGKVIDLTFRLLKYDSMNINNTTLLSYLTIY